MNHGFLTFLANFIHLAELSIYVRGHRKVTGIRHVIETLFIILDRYVNLFIFDLV